MDKYELLEKQMVWLVLIFGLGVAVCGYLIYYYGQQKNKAAITEEKWTDEHPNTCAMRFQFHTIDGKDLGFLYTTFYFKSPNNYGIESQNIIAKDAVIYFPVGNYEAEIVTNDYESKQIDFSITNDDISLRKGMDIPLEKKEAK